MDGVCSGIIQSLSAEDCIEWLQAVATNISNLTKHNVSMALKSSSYLQVMFDSNCHRGFMGLNMELSVHKLYLKLQSTQPCHQRMLIERNIFFLSGTKGGSWLSVLFAFPWYQPDSGANSKSAAGRILLRYAGVGG